MFLVRLYGNTGYYRYCDSGVSACPESGPG